MERLMKILSKKHKDKAGFTLIELMIVVIIVGILAAAAVPIYSAFVKRAYCSEAKATVGGIRAAEQVYYAEKSKWIIQGTTSTSTYDVAASNDDVLTVLGMSLTQNRWFNLTNADLTWGPITDISTTGDNVGCRILGKAGTTIDGIGAEIIFSTGEIYYTTNGTDWSE